MLLVSIKNPTTALAFGWTSGSDQMLIHPIYILGLQMMMLELEGPFEMNILKKYVC